MRQIHFYDLGNIEYGKAWQLQEELLKEAVSEKSKRITGGDSYAPQPIKNYLLFCEHPHVYTLGKSGDEKNLLVNDEELAALSATYYKTNRGGDITYHGPGQIVGYPVLDLEQFFTDLGRYMRSIEQVIINTLAHYNIEAGRLQGEPGVWLDPDDAQKARKICAVGVKASRWVTIHGWALNVNTDMSYFGHIVPCGITDKAVTSMEQELGTPLDIDAVRKVVRTEFAKVFETELIMDADALIPIA